MNLKEINNPFDINDYSNEQLKEISLQIREYILNYVSENGGYLSDNLSIVDIASTIYKVFDRNDHIYFNNSIDYAYKILNNQYDKLNNHENDYALARVIASSFVNKENNVVVMNGDDCDYGNNIELLNQICNLEHKIIIIYNDNSNNDKVSIFNKMLNNFRSASGYKNIKKAIKNSIKPVKYGDVIIDNIQKAKNSIKKTIIDENIFSSYNIDYIGPIDGHNHKSLIKAFKLAKIKEKTVVVHCITKSGFGYENALKCQNNYYKNIESFDLKTGLTFNNQDNEYKFVETIIAELLNKYMQDNENIVSICKDISSDCMNNLFSKKPKQTYKFNLSQNNLFNIAYSFTENNKIPYLCLTSDTLNDKNIINLLNNFDKPMIISSKISDDSCYLNKLINVDIYVPKDSNDLESILVYAINNNKATIILNDHKTMKFDKNDTNINLKVGKGDFIVNNDMKDVLIISYGANLNNIYKVINNNQFRYDLLDCSMINYFDNIKCIAKEYKNVYLFGKLYNYIDVDLKINNVHYLYNDEIDVLFNTIKGDLNV